MSRLRPAIRNHSPAEPSRPMLAEMSEAAATLQDEERVKDLAR